MSHSQGLLFVYGQCGPSVTEEEFNDWYDHEHAPARLTVEGFHTAWRYKAVDSLEPEWLAMYDLATPDVVNSEGYKALASKGSANEKDIVSRLALLNRRVYSLIGSLSKPSLPTSAIPAKYVLVVGVDVKPEDEADLNRWYQEEHYPLISKVPGWLRGRRYKLTSATELAGKADKKAPSPPKYLSIHEWDRADYASQAEFKDMFKTPWAERVYGYMLKREPRRFQLYKDFASTK